MRSKRRRNKVSAWRGLLVVAVALVFATLGLLASLAVRGHGGGLALASGSASPAAPWPGDDGEDAPTLAQFAAPIALPDLHGAMHTVPRRGRVQLINYWATWCGPCRQELPLLAAYVARHRSGDAEVVSIALDSREAAQSLLDSQPLPFRVLIEFPGDNDSSVALGNRSRSLPFSVLVASDGRVLRRHTGSFADAEQLSDWAKTKSAEAHTP